jgi:hypothetical protein
MVLQKPADSSMMQQPALVGDVVYVSNAAIRTGNDSGLSAQTYDSLEVCPSKTYDTPADDETILNLVSKAQTSRAELVHSDATHLDINVSPPQGNLLHEAAAPKTKLTQSEKWKLRQTVTTLVAKPCPKSPKAIAKYICELFKVKEQLHHLTCMAGHSKVVDERLHQVQTYFMRAYGTRDIAQMISQGP